MLLKALNEELLRSLGSLAKIGHNAAIVHCIENDDQIVLVALNSLISTNLWGKYFNQIKVASQQWKHPQMVVRFLC